MAATHSAVADPHLYLRAQSRWRPIEFVFWAARRSCLSCCSRTISRWRARLRSPRCSPCRSISSSAMRASCRSATRPSSGSAPTRPASSPPTAGAIRCWAWPSGAVVAGLFGYATSFIIARFRHLALIMITLGLGLLLHEAANTASWLTGGSDGLAGRADRAAARQLPLRSLRAIRPTPIR